MLAWINGSLVPESEATVSIFDRGFLFGDGVYELVRYFDGWPVAMDLHSARLDRSLRLIGIGGIDPGLLNRVGDALLDANGLRDASIYVQVTRGAGAVRAHMPSPDLVPTVVGIATATPSIAAFDRPDLVRAIVRPDLRWHRCEIKTISLAGNILSLIEAQSAGADECILVRDGFVGEGAYTNVAIVRDGALVTCPLDDPASPVLHGTMRRWMLDAAHAGGLRVEERRITETELRGADEVLVQSSRRLVAAVAALDGVPVGHGAAGPACRLLFEAMRARIVRHARGTA